MWTFFYFSFNYHIIYKVIASLLGLLYIVFVVYKGIKKILDGIRKIRISHYKLNETHSAMLSKKNNTAGIEQELLDKINDTNLRQFEGRLLFREVRSEYLLSYIGYSFVIFSSLLPTFFAIIYYYIGSFSDCVVGSSGNFDYLYFSYTTITTLGYGDFAPIGICRFFSAVEAILGYLTLGLISALVYAIVSNQFIDIEPIS